MTRLSQCILLKILQHDVTCNFEICQYLVHCGGQEFRVMRTYFSVVCTVMQRALTSGGRISRPSPNQVIITLPHQKTRLPHLVIQRRTTILDVGLLFFLRLPKLCKIQEVSYEFRIAPSFCSQYRIDCICRVAN